MPESRSLIGTPASWDLKLLDVWAPGKSANKWKITRRTSIDIRTHLELYGIKHFDSDEYWDWGGEQLGMNLGEKLNKYREPIVQGNATDSEFRQFYDLIARPRVAAVVHSMKADAIRASCEAIDAAIGDQTAVLDVGCSIGYLTTYYGRANHRRKVVGWDVTEKAVQVAKRLAKKLGVRNVTFECRDIIRNAPERKFGAICSAQVLAYFDDQLPIALEHISGSLAKDGVLVCVEALGNSEDAQEFIDSVSEVGLNITSFAFAHFSDIGQRGAYPVMCFSRSETALDVDLRSEYATISRALGGP